MIEITAKLSRGSVYFSGEIVKCYVTFKNVAALDVQKGPTDVASETLAWAGVQIYCHCILDETKAQFVNDTKTALQGAAFSPETSFNPSKSERGHIVFSTIPQILVCDLKLHSNESKTFLYQEQLPSYSPPSYYGSSIKYLYKLTIGTQRVNANIQLLRMPLRILTVDTNGPPPAVENGDNHFFGDDDGISGEAAVNGLLNGSCPEDRILDIVLHKLDCLTAKRSPSSYVITNQLGQVARFFLLKSTFKLGEDVVGVFSFKEANVPCVQFSVSLQSEEVISDECKLSASKSATCVTNYSKYHEFCLHTSNTQVILPIPLTITPAFSTNMVSLAWRLHFEFVTTKPDEVSSIDVHDTQGVMERSQSEIKVQTMVWDLPLTIHATHPVQVARGLQMPASSSVTV